MTVNERWVQVICVDRQGHRCVVSGSKGDETYIWPPGNPESQWVPESIADLLMHLQLNKFEVAREGIAVPVAKEWTPDTKNSRCLIYTSPTEGRGGSRPGCGRKPLSLAKLKRPDLARLTISKRPELVS